MKIIKPLFIIAILITSMKLIASEQEFPIEPIKSGDAYTWSLNQEVSVSIRTNCPFRGDKIFKKAGYCNSSFNIDYEPDESENADIKPAYRNQNWVSIYAGDTSITSKSQYYANDDDKRVIKALVEQGENPVLSLIYFKNNKEILDDGVEFISEKYRLIGFATSLEKSRELGQAENKTRVTQHNIISGVAIFICIVVLYWIIKLFINKIIPKLKAKNSEIIQKRAEKREMSTISKISKEEAIRHTVRSSIANNVNMHQPTQEQIDVIKQQIKEALDKDDSKTALALMSILSGMPK